MGYRSFGAVWLSSKAKEILPTELLDDLGDWDLGYEQHNVWQFSYWKWYEDSPNYPMVTAWIDFFFKCDVEEIAYDFVRIGEDYEDSEVRTGLKFSLDRDWSIHNWYDEEEI